MSPVLGSMETVIIESVRRLNRPGPASPPSSSTFTRSTPANGSTVVLVAPGSAGTVVPPTSVVVVSTMPGSAVTASCERNTLATALSVMRT